MTGLAIERPDLSGTARSFAVWGFVVGQWLLPATDPMEMVAPPLPITAYLWGALLAVSMGLAAWGTISADEGTGRTSTI